MKTLTTALTLFGFIGTFAFASNDATYFGCYRPQTNGVPGCVGKIGCVDVNIGINSRGETKAIAWRKREKQFLRRKIVEIGDVNNSVSTITLGEGPIDFEPNNASIQVTQLELSSNPKTPTSIPVVGSAILKDSTGTYSIDLECFRFDSVEYNLFWAHEPNTDQRNDVRIKLMNAVEGK